MLNRKTTYGIHALLFLARQEHDVWTPAGYIASALGISKKFLERILSELRAESMVQSQSGRDGGYALGSEGLKICLADIVRILEGPIALLPCASHRFYTPCAECPNPDQCGVQDALVQVRNDTVHSLKATTLASMLQAEQDFQKGKTQMRRPTPYLGI